MNPNLVLENYKERPAEELRGYLQGYVDAYMEIEEQQRQMNELTKNKED